MHMYQPSNGSNRQLKNSLWFRCLKGVCLSCLHTIIMIDVVLSLLYYLFIRLLLDCCFFFLKFFHLIVPATYLYNEKEKRRIILTATFTTRVIDVCLRAFVCRSVLVHACVGEICVSIFLSSFFSSSLSLCLAFFFSLLYSTR